MSYTPGWLLLGTIVRQRRERLGLTQEDIARRSGPSSATVRTIERGNHEEKRFRLRTLNDLDTALGWSQGTTHTLVQGGQCSEDDFDALVEALNEDAAPVIHSQATPSTPETSELWDTIYGELRVLKTMAADLSDHPGNQAKIDDLEYRIMTLMHLMRLHRTSAEGKNADDDEDPGMLARAS